MPRGFATIDFETTGLAPGRGARAIEIAVVHSDADGAVTGQWDTLLRADLTVGPQHIHRISPRDLVTAPSFAQIAPELLELLRGRVVVAHNAGFDLRFLRAEFERAGYHHPVAQVSLCTLRLARTYLPDQRRSLAHCCRTFGIDLTDAHRASVDARATAELLEAYIANSADRHGWSAELDRAAAQPFTPLPSSGTPWHPRERARPRPSTRPHFA
jgi:DNA polymerase-3 subunit epsilon